MENVLGKITKFGEMINNKFPRRQLNGVHFKFKSVPRTMNTRK